MHELHPHKVSLSSLPKLQQPAISHLQPSRQEPTCTAGHPTTEPQQPSIISIVLLLHLSPAASNASSHLQHSLPSHHASPLHTTSHPGPSSNSPAHTCPASAPTYSSTLCLPDWVPASSSAGTSSRTGPSTCSPTASPWPVELRAQMGESLPGFKKATQSPTNNQHMTIIDCTCEDMRVPHATLSGLWLFCLVKWSREDLFFAICLQ